MKRLFIAIPVNVQPALVQLLSDLQHHFSEDKINWVSPGNIHITLQFLGETQETIIPRLTQIIEDTASAFSEGEATLEGLGYFGSKRDPRVIYSRIQGFEKLSDMASMLHGLTSPEGFRNDHPEFRAHLTLGRIKHIQNKFRFFELIQSYGNQPIQTIKIGEVILYESILRPQGPIYKPIFRKALQDKRG